MSTVLEVEDEVRDLAAAWRTLSVVGLASIVSALNGTALNVALPTLTQHFSASALQASLILIGFQFTMTVLMLLFGRLADIRGRRSMYLTGLAVFTLASLLLGFSPNVEVLIGLRVVQAVGAAMLLTNSAALVTDAFPRDRLGQGMGLYIASFSIASLFGPVAGGFMVETWGWRWLFWYNVPLGLICLAWAWVALRPRPVVHAVRPGIDVLGNVLSVASLGSLLWAVSQVTEQGWASAPVLLGLIAFVILLALFILWERRAAHPLLDFALFRQRSFSFGTAGTFLNAVTRFPPALLLAVYFQSVRGQNAIEAGLAVLPLVGSSLVGSLLVSVLTRVMTASLLARLAGITATSGLVLLAVAIEPQVHPAYIIVGQVLVGLGSGAFLPANTTTILDPLPSSRMGVANGVRLMIMNTGASLGTALSISLLTSLVAPDLVDVVMAGTLAVEAPGAMPDLMGGFRLAYGVCAAGSLVAVVFSYLDGSGRTPPTKAPRRA